MSSPIPADESKFIAEAAKYLENPSLLATIAHHVGKPVEWLLAGVDRISPISIAHLVEHMLNGILHGATATVSSKPLDLGFREAHEKSRRNGRWHTATTAVTGGVGGAFGPMALAVELPITTGIMFRSIASTARTFGKDLSDPATFLDCVSAFSFGGGAGTSDDAMDSAYLTLRAAMATEVHLASQFLVRNTGESFAQQLAKGNCPRLVAFLSQVAAQFNVALTPKLVAVVLPGISVATGALVNSAFTEHFNRIAEYHFGMQRLAVTHGDDTVYGAYRVAACEQRRRQPAHRLAPRC